MPVLEGMAAGIPVVCSGKGSLREVAGKAGIIPDSDSPHSYAASLEVAITPGMQRDTIVRQGYEWARQFTWRRTAEVTAQVYRNVWHDPLASRIRSKPRLAAEVDESRRVS